MRKIAIIFISLLISGTTYADNLFQEVNIKDLHIKSLSPGDGRMVMADRAGNVKEVKLGDTVGYEQAEVIEIEKTAVLIDRGEYETRIPAVMAVGKSPTR